MSKPSQESGKALCCINTQHVSELLHSTLHEIAGPTGRIQRLSALIQNRSANTADDDMKSLLSHMERAAAAIDESLKAVRRYAEAIDPPYEYVRFPLIQAVSSAQARLESAISESGTRITHPELPVLEGDPKRMGLVLHELLSNAIKFCPHQAPAIHISAVDQGENILVSVHDNGIGIAKPQTERIFEPFTKLMGSEFPGTGMGLTIAQAVVEIYCGKMWAESVLGAGSTFLFTVPS